MPQRFLRLACLCALLSAPFVVCAVEAPAATAEQIRKKVGIYVWGQVPDLAGAVDDVKKLGADRAIRAFIGPWSDNPPYRTDTRPLAAKLADRGIRKLIREFPVVMLTAYDSFSYAKAYDPEFKPSASDLQNGKRPRHPMHPSSKVVADLAKMTPADAAAFLGKVRDEFRDFTLELAIYNRTFIVSNWEAENDVPDSKDWGWFARYLQARCDGIVAGRDAAKRKGYPGRVYTAFEFTIVPGFKGRPSGLSELGAKLRGVDYLSYSSWWSIGSDYDAARIRQSFRAAFQSIRTGAKAAGLPAKVIVGEFGEYWDLHPGGERMRAIAEEAIDDGAEYLFNWVLYDQPGETDEQGRDASHFGKYDLRRRLTPQGSAFQRWFVDGTPQRASPASSGGMGKR